MFYTFIILCYWYSQWTRKIYRVLWKDVQDKAIKLGYTTQKEIKKQTIISIIVLYLPCFVLVPLMVCYINGAKEFNEIFIQSLLIMYIMGLFDRFLLIGIG